MKKYISFLFMLFLVSNLLAQEKIDSTKTIENVVVKETYKASFEEEKFPVSLKLDFSNIVQIPVQINWDAINPEKMVANLDNWDHFSFKFSNPEFSNIKPQPVKVFHAQFSNLAKWKLEILSSDGTLLRCISGKGNPKESILWDGFGTNGELFTPGQNYTYSFTANDKAGNKRTFAGETFSESAVFLHVENKIWVGIDEAKLFSSEGYGLLQSAPDYCKELASLIRYYSSKYEISFNSSHPQKDEFIKLLAQELGRDADFFKQKPLNNTNHKCFSFWIE